MHWVELAVIFAVLLLFSKPLGGYLFQVLDPKGKTVLDPVLKPIENRLYRWSKIDPLVEQDWKAYLFALLGFSLVCAVFVTVLLAFQYYLPFNPQKFKAPSWDLNINTSWSFITNTNWQNYSGESTMSYFSQMAALSVQNFMSPAVGLAAAAALVRGIARNASQTIGNFWTDLIRVTLYLLLPMAVIAATIFIAEGVPQNFKDYVQAQTLEGATQTIPQGPIASQEAIKMLGSNGGGFMNTNSAHPYENPSPFSNFFQIFLILLIPIAQIHYFGKSVNNTKHSWCIITGLGVLFLVGLLCVASWENAGNPAIAKLGITGGNWEGKEQRFGMFDSSLFVCATTAVSCGAVNCAHDSLMPMSGFIPLLNMELSEVIFGGAGAGLYTLILFILLAIFVSGLIIGRTPEYLGKKIEIFDIKMTTLAVLPYVLLVHGFTILAICTNWGLKALGNSGPHGFSEILYAFSSCAANNGSAYGGLSGNTPAYNMALGFALLLGRFLVIAPVIALAGSLAQKKIIPKTTASFPVSSPLFISLLIGVILLFGALTFLPALTMGPIIEQFELIKGVLFK